MLIRSMLINSFICSILAFATSAFAQPQVEIEFVTTFGHFGKTQPGTFDWPVAIAFDDQDRIIIADNDNHRIQRCNAQGSCEAFGRRGSQLGEFVWPLGVAVDSLGRIIVSEAGNDRIQLGDFAGNWTSFGSTGHVSPGEFRLPAGIAVDDQDRIIIADEKNHRIQICDDLGNCSAFGSLGASLGSFNTPRAVGVTSQGKILVADSANNRIQICSYEGECTSFGSFGEAAGQIRHPSGVTADSQDRVLVSDRDNYRFQICDLSGACVAFGEFGTGPGQFRQPEAVAVDDQNRIYVADAVNQNIQIFQATYADEPPPGPFQINAGHSGAWYNPATDGQGQLIDVVPETQYMFLAWFTFNDGASNNPDQQQWYTAQGNYSGNTADLILYETLGGQFDDPQETSTNPVGTVTVSFTDCAQGQIVYSIDTDGREGTIPLERLIPGSDYICEDQSGKAAVTTEAVDINAGMDGAWYDTGKPGQGFLIDAHPNPDGGNFIFVAWFTYGDDTASGQRWLTAQGDFAGSVAAIDLWETTGGRFDDPQAVNPEKVGTMNLDFTDCSNAQLSYSLTDEDLAGDMELSRLIPGGQALCEELAGAE